MSLLEISENEVQFKEKSSTADDIVEIVYGNDVHKFLEFLKESGPNTDLNVQAKQGMSLSHIAASNDSLPILSELTSRGVHLHYIDDNCETVLHAAAKKASRNVLTFLLDHKVELNFQNKIGNSPIHCAVTEGNLIAIDLLCKANCKINLRNKNGETPLCLAVILGKLDSAKVLLNHKADLNAEDKNGNTPLHHAICRHQTTIALMLINAGAHVNQPDLNEQNPKYSQGKDSKGKYYQTLQTKFVALKYRYLVEENENNNLREKIRKLERERNKLYDETVPYSKHSNLSNELVEEHKWVESAELRVDRIVTQLMDSVMRNATTSNVAELQPTSDKIILPTAQNLPSTNSRSIRRARHRRKMRIEAALTKKLV